MPVKIIQYIEGNIKMLGDKFNILPKHYKEQILYRVEKCKNDCLKQGRCKICGCDLPGKFYVGKSCNKGTIFPDLMSKDEWKEYKSINHIKIDEDN